MYFKKREYILETLKSIYNQTYQNFELILVYDEENKRDIILLIDFKNLQIKK